MARGALHRLAILYALAVALACPSLLAASEEGPPPAPAGAQSDVAPATGAPTAEPPRAEEPTGALPQSPGSQQPAPPTPDPPEEAVPGGVKARAAASGSVTMRDFSFSPATVTLNTGESVTWANRGGEPHTATGDGFDTGTVEPGESGSATFARAGSFSYVCSIHPQMRGTVRVLAGASDGTGGASPSAGGEADSESGSPAGSEGGPTLPASGLDAGLLGILGVALVGLGIAIRRRPAEG